MARQRLPDVPEGFQLLSRRLSNRFPDRLATAPQRPGRGEGLPGPNHAFCQSKVCVQIDALWPAAVFQIFGLAWPPSCMPPYGPLYGETANGSLNVARRLASEGHRWWCGSLVLNPKGVQPRLVGAFGWRRGGCLTAFIMQVCSRVWTGSVNWPG